LVLRQLGVPTVIVPMGILADIGMTFAARAYEDSSLLRIASTHEATGDRRVPPPLTPPL
jgi:amidase